MTTDTPTDVDTSATETDQLTVEEAADTVDQADLGEDDGAGSHERMFGQRRLRSEDPPLLGEAVAGRQGQVGHGDGDRLPPHRGLRHDRTALVTGATPQLAPQSDPLYRTDRPSHQET
ncbi:MAG TPA: hypothetical protein PLV41_07785, partial [Miltoncostaeales bacterium]|nr:hypothetical protein [Miltoncostaeales bacterium]